jgi:2-methylcitrate dehydratase
MIAIPILFGRLTAADPRIDKLRAKIICVENKRYTEDYHDPKKRSIANALTIEFKDGKKLKEIVCEYPIGHKRRRKEGIPLLEAKFRTNLARRFSREQQDRILAVSLDQRKLGSMAVNEYVDLYVI